LLEKLNKPVIEITNGRKYYQDSTEVKRFPSEDDLKGHRFGIVYLCGAQREKCIPRIEACLRKFTKRTFRLEALIH